LIYLFGTWAEAVGLGKAKMNALTGADTPWNTLSSTFAPWTKWFVIVGSVSSMFAVMINSNNGIVRILNTMGREKLLPGILGRIDPKRRTPGHAVAYVSVFSIGTAVLVGIFSGGLGSPTGGSNVYGYLGFALTVAILPVYALSNAAVIKYFQRRPARHLAVRRRRSDGCAADRADHREPGGALQLGALVHRRLAGPGRDRRDLARPQPARRPGPSGVDHGDG
jgi:amino acid transporter